MEFKFDGFDDTNVPFMIDFVLNERFVALVVDGELNARWMIDEIIADGSDSIVVNLVCDETEGSFDGLMKLDYNNYTVTIMTGSIDSYRVKCSPDFVNRIFEMFDTDDMRKEFFHYIDEAEEELLTKGRHIKLLQWLEVLKNRADDVSSVDEMYALIASFTSMMSDHGLIALGP